MELTLVYTHSLISGNDNILYSLFQTSFISFSTTASLKEWQICFITLSTAPEPLTLVKGFLAPMGTLNRYLSKGNLYLGWVNFKSTSSREVKITSVCWDASACSSVGSLSACWSGWNGACSSSTPSPSLSPADQSWWYIDQEDDYFCHIKYSYTAFIISKANFNEIIIFEASPCGWLWTPHWRTPSQAFPCQSRPSWKTILKPLSLIRIRISSMLLLHLMIKLSRCSV